jgi:hypothetical protein
MKSLMLATTALFLIGGSAAYAATGAYMIVVTSGKNPNNGGGVTSMPFNTLANCQAEAKKLPASTTSNDAWLSAYCVENK